MEQTRMNYPNFPQPQGLYHPENEKDGCGVGLVVNIKGGKSHARYTGSTVAKEMLADWDAYVDQFIKVMPIEYKKVLHAQRLAALEAKIATVERDY